MMQTSQLLFRECGEKGSPGWLLGGDIGLGVGFVWVKSYYFGGLIVAGPGLRNFEPLFNDIE